MTVVACGGGSSESRSSDSSSASSNTIRIAVAAPMTGDNANYGLGFYNAALMMAMEGPSEKIANDPKVKKAYLGG